MKPERILGISTTIALLALPVGARSEEPAPLAGIVMQVANLTTNEGFVHCDLYVTKEGFPNDPRRAMARLKVRPNGKRATCVFRDVEAGRYAVALWHDVDGDGVFDTNWIGIPSEPVGASNNAKGTMGPPSFKDAAFDYGPPLVRQTIRLE